MLGLITRSFFDFPGSPQAMEASPYFGVAAGQVMLLGIWCALSKGSIVLRGLALCLGVTLVWLTFFYDVLDVLSRSYFILTLFVTIAGLALPTLFTALLILGSTYFFHSRLDHRSLASSGESRLLQFGLRDLFVATTIAAVLLMGARAVRHFYHGAHRVDDWEVFVFSLIIAVGYPMIAVTAVSACFATRQLVPRSAMAVITAGTVAGFPLLIVPFNADSGTLYVVATIIGTLIVFAALWVVRICDYRLVSVESLTGNKHSLS
ncbi:MAG: hypothetical protein K8T91_19260 [Planctomycetes bacterium]|nr:hypothetical protein [Planctomycetota bacterium]